jgi:hypothetical protein
MRYVGSKNRADKGTGIGACVCVCVCVCVELSGVG